MSDNKNLPHIPIYIGDWERDCNVLSLEAEMAWMKIIFKMHLSGKQATYKISAKGLQNLWKSDADKVQGIVNELLFEEICEITEITGGFIFKNRRIAKENELSEIRSKAAKSRYKKGKTSSKDLQNNNQTKSKNVQNTDNDNDNESDNEVEETTLEKSEKPLPEQPKKFSFRNSLLKLGADKKLLSDWLKVRKDKNASNTETALKGFLTQVEKSGKEINEILRICAEKSWKGFKAEWLTNDQNYSRNGEERLNQIQRDYLVARRDV